MWLLGRWLRKGWELLRLAAYRAVIPPPRPPASPPSPPLSDPIEAALEYARRRDAAARAQQQAKKAAPSETHIISSTEGTQRYPIRFRRGPF